MKVAAVILNYNDADSTLDAVRRISGYDSIDTVIVVDNASTDNSAEKLQSCLREMNRALMNQPDEDDDDEYHRYMLVESEKNGGYGAGNNLGVQYAYEIAGADLVLIANPDSVFSEKLIEDMAYCFSEDQDIAVVGALMAQKDGRVTYEDCIRSAWPLRSLMGELLSTGPFTRRLLRKRLNYDASKFIGHSFVEVDVVHGSLLMVDADRFMACEGFDEDMFLYCEENVLAYKMKENGCKEAVLLDGSYIHKGSGSITDQNGYRAVRRQRQRQKSERWYYQNYLGASAAAMAFVKLFQGFVMLETFFLQRFGIL